jgi:hypothetical protein
MNCLNSFIINVRGLGVFTPTGVDTWADGGLNTFFSLNTSSNRSRYNIQGFKSIEIHGVEVIGNVTHDTTQTGFGAIVTDWSFQIELKGTLPLVSGVVQSSPNNWNILATGTEPLIYRLSKNTNIVKFASPIQSTEYIEFQGLFAQGSGVENINGVGLEWHLDFIFYYKYQGED